MSSRGYTVLGWASGRSPGSSRKQKMAQNRVKIGAAATVALVLVGGVLAARATGDDG